GSGGPSGVRSGDASPRGAATGGGGIAVGRAIHGAGSDSYRSSGGASYADHIAGRILGGDLGTRPSESGGGVPTYSRPRDGAASAGTAVPRGSVPITGGSGVLPFINFGAGGYYGNGYYGGYPYNSYYGYPFGSMGYAMGYFGYDPWFASTMMGAFSADPWYGGYGSTPQLGSTNSYVGGDDASLRLKIKPSSAEVFADGYFVGVVDDFNGMFQKLRIEAGPHRIEVRAPGYETLDIDVRLTSGKTTVYQGELKKIQ
ncbi:MAG TPA: PEGA domain-containing protein, partial [Vicinamibacterales bacterium]|nr:PEGA domain-containing protein [Vicinamibacterales bacterium]